MWKPSVILALAICTFFASSDAQDTCGSPTDAPGESTSTEVSNSGTLYFYPSFDSSCVGTVMAYEFCYRYTQITGPPDDVVSIVVLESEGENYRVVWTGNEREDRNCDTVTLIQGVDRCCDRTDLAADQMFNVSTNHAYGFVTPSITQNILLTLETRAHSYLLSAQAPLNDPDNLPAVGSTLTPTNLGISGMQLQSLLQRSVQFIIQPPPATDTPDPGTTDPGTTDPSTTDPSTTDPGTTDPGTTDPGTTDPGTTDPGTTDPGTTDPGTTDPSTTDPSTTDPDTVGGGGANGGAIAAGVIIPLLVIGGVAVAVVIAMVIWRRRHSKSETIVYSGEPSKGNSYANAIYETQIDPHYSAQEKAGAETGEEGPHDYAVPDQTQFSKEGPQEYLESVPGIIPYAVLPGSNRTMPGMTTVASSGSPPAASTISTLPIAEQSHFNPYGSFISERGSIVTRSARHGSLLSNHQAPENIYMVPANDEQSLYAQIKAMNLRHIKRNTVKITDHLGSGQFGTVNRGEWESPDGAVEVAVKMLKAGSAQEDKVKFLQEAAMMGQFQHNNIVQLYGVVTIGEPKMIVLELLEKGDLHNHLKSLQLEGEKVDSELPHMLLSFSRQVASGLAYLAAKAFVHRDLAARNILVAGDGETIKIADFGMSRDLADENYYVAHGGKIPVKWTAPEAIHFKRYSTASDVWSFGAVMYEIWSLGYKPFEGYSNGQAMSMVDSRMRLPPPPGCPRAIYDIMIKCWHPDAAQRPDAAKIAQWLSRPDPQLLRWREEDKAVHPGASLLGAELDAAVALYKELQETYINASETH